MAVAVAMAATNDSGGSGGDRRRRWRAAGGASPPAIPRVIAGHNSAGAFGCQTEPTRRRNVWPELDRAGDGSAPQRATVSGRMGGEEGGL